MPEKEVFLVVAYDIVSDRRRNRLFKVLKGYGVRANYSVFECRLRKRTISDLKNKVCSIINKKEDSVLFYELCRSCVAKKDSFGYKGSKDKRRDVTII